MSSSCAGRQSRVHSAHIGQDVVVQYCWHPLYGRQVRLILAERRASGEIAHVELEPGVVTKVAAWKLDRLVCASLTIGEPRVSMSALVDLHGLLTTCESRLLSAYGNTVMQEVHNGSPGTVHHSSFGPRPTTKVCSPDTHSPTRPRSRRRQPPRDDNRATQSSSQDVGTASSGSERLSNQGGER